jgi:hypothetical protein
MFGCQMSSYGVVCAKGDFDTCVLECLRDGSCLSTYVCELDPLGFFLYTFGLVWFGLFVHPFSHIYNIGHVSYRLQFTTKLVIYGHPHDTV